MSHNEGVPGQLFIAFRHLDGYAVAVVLENLGKSPSSLLIGKYDGKVDVS